MLRFGPAIFNSQGSPLRRQAEGLFGCRHDFCLFSTTSQQWIRPQDIFLLRTGEPCARACQDDYFGREAEHWRNLANEAGDR